MSNSMIDLEGISRLRSTAATRMSVERKIGNNGSSTRPAESQHPCKLDLAHPAISCGTANRSGATRSTLLLPVSEIAARNASYQNYQNGKRRLRQSIRVRASADDRSKAVLQQPLQSRQLEAYDAACGSAEGDPCLPRNCAFCTVSSNLARPSAQELVISADC